MLKTAQIVLRVASQRQQPSGVRINRKLGVESAQITGSNGQPLSIVNGIIYTLPGEDVTISWSGGSETLNSISAVQFTDASFTIQTVGVTTADLIMCDGNNGDYGIHGIDDNAILTTAALGQISRKKTRPQSGLALI